VDYSRFDLPDFAGVKKRDYFLALVSGGLLAAAFPKLGLSILAWVAFVPLLLACGRKSAGKAFKLGFVSGIAAYAGILYWINIVVTTYGKLHPVVSFIVFMILVVYLAAYVGVFMYLVRKAEEKGVPVLLSFPVLWVALEYLRSFLLTGFPWASLGYSQYSVLSLIQIADVTGVYGISFLIALANAVVYELIKGVVKKERSIHPGRGVVIFLILFAATVVYGFTKLDRAETGNGHPERPEQVLGVAGGDEDVDAQRRRDHRNAEEPNGDAHVPDPQRLRRIGVGRRSFDELCKCCHANPRTVVDVMCIRRL